MTFKINGSFVLRISQYLLEKNKTKQKLPQRTIAGTSEPYKDACSLVLVP